MAVLVTYASKHGSTREIAERIAEQLRRQGNDAQAAPVDEAESPAAYEAVVLGSAVYYGAWMKEAVEYARVHRGALAARPVWLFSVGPLGAEVKDVEEQPKEIAELRKLIAPRGHRIFFGVLDHHTLSFGERMVAKAVRASEGDFRDWAAIDGWAVEIARALAPLGATAGAE
jgi:menaquinone-dependent protoporphyrinogen oxidase